jgi:outer membrane protein OmpA-like peptidoglycan-associated protein
MDPKGIAIVLAMVVFFFTIPAPNINSVTPNNGANNNLVSVEVNGAKFDQNATVKLTKSGEEDITATNVKVISEQKISCSFNIKEKLIGKWDVVVTNKKFRSTTLSDGFEIGYPAPLVSEVTPKQSFNNDITVLVIKGSAFRAGASVLLTNKQMDIGASKVQVVSATQVNCEVNLKQADPGVYHVKVSNDDGKTGTLVNGFEVAGSPKPVIEVEKPIIDGITPNKGFNNGMILTRINGNHFEPGSIAKLSRNGQDDLPGLNMKVEESAHITCFFDISGQPEGQFNVEVISPSGQKAILTDGFTVEKFVPSLTDLNKTLKAIYFDFDKADLRANQVSGIAADLKILKAYPQFYIILGGHADERGGINYNLDLSARRAGIIKKYLTENGINPERITIYAYGKEFPAVKGHNESSWWHNRRVEVMVWEVQPTGKAGTKKSQDSIQYFKVPNKKIGAQ